MGLLSKLIPYKRSLSLNHEVMCTILLENSPVDYEFKEALANMGRVKNRLNAEKLSSVFLSFSSPLLKGKKE